MTQLAPLLHHRGFRDLLVGQAVSSFGDWMATVALMALVLDVSGSPAAVGGVLALRLMPSVFAGPLAATAALRWDRRRTMLTMDLVRAPLVLLIPFVPALWWIYLWAFLTEVANLVFLPARDAAIPDLVDDEQLPTANGLVLVSSYGNIPIGAAAFAGLSSLAALVGEPFDDPFLLVFALDAATYLVSFAFIRRIDLAGTPGEEDVATGAGTSGTRSFFEAVRSPLLRAVLPGLATVVVGIGALFSLGIVYVREVLGASDMAFGVLIAIFGVGASLSVWWVQQRRGARLIRLIRFAVAAMGAILATMALIENLLWSFAVAVPFGASAAAALVGSLTYLQDVMTGRRRVIGFAAFHMVFRFGMSLSAITAGFVVGRVPTVRWPLVGRVAPASVVLFAAGVLVALGALGIRPAPLVEADGSAEPVEEDATT